MADARELLDELKLVFSGRNSLLDSILPPLLFIVCNALFSFNAALWTALAAGVAFTLLRLLRRQPAWYALGGLVAALVAVSLAFLLKRAEAFFLPTLINGAFTTVVLLLSVLLRRPAVAFTSFLTRRWSLDWYWHARVRPAYSEVTLVWAAFSAVKLSAQFFFYRRGEVDALAIFNLVSGWPTLILLLIFTYLYGLKRLKQLGGPSVEEFKLQAPPPWQGQQRGF